MNQRPLFPIWLALVLFCLSLTLPVAQASSPVSRPKQGAGKEEKVRYKGKLVTLAEKSAMERGLVEHEGKWVTKKELKLLKKGKVRHRGRWMDKKDREKMEKGLLPRGKDWVPRAEADALHSNWRKGWELSGLHFYVRTDGPEDLGAELLMALEAAAPAYQEFFMNRTPEKPKKLTRRVDDIKIPGALMPVFLFKDKQGFQDFCEDHDAKGWAHTTGFFDSGLEVFVTYDPGEGRQTLISRTVGAVSELYTWYAWKDRVPDWFGEGARRYFERVKWDRETETLEVGLLYESLIDELPVKGLMPLRKLLRTSPREVQGRSRWAWGGQCWLLCHFMQKNKDSVFYPTWEKLCEKYIKVPSFTDMQEAANDHGAKLFEKIFKKQMAELETALFQYSKELRAP